MTDAPPGSAPPNRRPARNWLAGNADRGDSVRLAAFGDGVLAIAITLLILVARVDQLLLLANLLLLGFVAFLPLPTRLVASTPAAATPAPRCCSTAPP